MTKKHGSSAVTGTEGIREQHARLLKRVETCRDKPGEHDTLCREILREFDRLVEDMKAFYGSMKSAEEYEWLVAAVHDWEVALSSVLRIPRNIRREIGMSLKFPDVEPARRVLGADEVAQYLNRKAYKIGQSRKLAALSGLLAHLEAHPQQIHSAIRSSPQETEEDWYGAMTCLALEILDGRIDFARQLGPELYRLLGEVWLDDMKRVKAYLIWEARGAQWDPGGWTRNSLVASDELNDRALDESLKVSSKSFPHLKVYLEQRYFADGLLDLSEGRGAHLLIANKARRLWQLGGCRGDALSHWGAAEKYVRLFYENIIGAVLEGDAGCVAAVIEGLRVSRSKPGSFSMMNCMEACLVLYCLEAGALREACEADTYLL